MNVSFQMPLIKTVMQSENYKQWFHRNYSLSKLVPITVWIRSYNLQFMIRDIISGLTGNVFISNNHLAKDCNVLITKFHIIRILYIK